MDGCRLPSRPESSDRRRIIISAENCGTSNQHVCTGGEDSSRVVNFDAAIDLQQRTTPDTVEHAPCCAHLVEAGLDERLSTESGIHGHDKEKIDVRKNFFDRVQ